MKYNCDLVEQITTFDVRSDRARHLETIWCQNQGAWWKSCEQCTETSPLPHHSESSTVKAKDSKPSESQVDGGGVNDGVLELIWLGLWGSTGGGKWLGTTELVSSRNRLTEGHCWHGNNIANYRTAGSLCSQQWESKRYICFPNSWKTQLHSIAQRQMKQGLHLTVTLQGKVIYMLSRAATNIWRKAVISDETDVYDANRHIFFLFFKFYFHYHFLHRIG